MAHLRRAKNCFVDFSTDILRLSQKCQPENKHKIIFGYVFFVKFLVSFVNLVVEFFTTKIHEGAQRPVAPKYNSVLVDLKILLRRPFLFNKIAGK